MKVKLFLVALVLAGCSLMNQMRLTKDYKLNEMIKTKTGNPMFSVYDGAYNNYKMKFASGVKMELVYVGSENNVINVTYREYMISNFSEYIKDGFTEHLKYDMKESKVISYKNFEIEVLEYNNRELKFRVVKDN